MRTQREQQNKCAEKTAIKTMGCKINQGKLQIQP
jgi:hypothetical protein